LHSSSSHLKQANSSMVFSTLDSYYSRRAFTALSSFSRPSLLFSSSTISLWNCSFFYE
jgi:hypothetical protein